MSPQCPHLPAVVAQVLSQCQGALAHGTYKGLRDTIFCLLIVFSRLMGEVTKFYVKGQGSVLQLC